VTALPTASPATIARALTFFKVSAITAGIAMFILIAEMVLKYGFDNPVLTWWSPVHGVIFMVLAVAATNLGFKVGWSLIRIGLILLGSCVPFVAFVIERRVAREVEPLTLDRVSVT
jgi:integral membrane protein